MDLYLKTVTYNSNDLQFYNDYMSIYFISIQTNNLLYHYFYTGG